MPSEIAQAISALIRSGRVDNQPTYSIPGFKTVDIYPIFEHAFTEKAKLTLTTKTNNLVYQYNNKVPSAHVLVLLSKLNLKTCAMYKGVVADDMYVRAFDLVHFVASRATKDKLPKAIEKVISVINDVAEKDFTKASMLQLSVIELMETSSLELEYVVISYITLTDKGSKYVEQHMPDMFVKEGEIPARIE